MASDADEPPDIKLGSPFPDETELSESFNKLLLSFPIIPLVRPDMPLPESAVLEYIPFGSSSLVLLSSFPTVFPPLGPGACPAICANFFILVIVNAAPVAPPSKPGVLAFSNPNIFLINFSAGIINPIATKVYIIFVAAKSYAIEISNIYNIKCIGCISKLKIYSLSHILNACAFPSEILSIEYVIATKGAITVKNARYNTLFKYVNAKNIV